VREAVGDHGADFKGGIFFANKCATTQKMTYNARLDGALAQLVRAMES
jgi:hypothetical protein